jgi:fatty-acid desaturase
MFKTFKNPHVTQVHLPAHALGLLSLCWVAFNPSWLTLLAFLVFNFWFSGLGVSIGFHRYFSHRAFKTNRFWHHAMLIGGSLAGQGSVVFWTALHRLHHPNSDGERDIHTPRKGFWHAYMGWIFTLDPVQVPMAKASDVIRDPVARFTHRHYNRLLQLWWLSLVCIAVLAPVTQPIIAGALIAGMWSIHQEAIINSACHNPRLGVAPYVSRPQDDSRNIWWLHWITWGQAYHHNHHVWPASANFCVDGKQDLGYRVIKLIEKRDLRTVEKRGQSVQQGV